jgi:hypothetical protein
MKFGRLRKIFRILKTMRFSEVFSILVLLPKVFEIFQKKSVSHDWALLPTVKISAQTGEICGL